MQIYLGGEKNMKIKVTALNATKDIELKVGEEVILIHNPQSKGYQYDKKAIDVYDSTKTTQLGVIGNKFGSTVIDDTTNNEELYDQMVKRNLMKSDGTMSIKGKVVGEGKVYFRNSTTRKAIIIEVYLPNLQTSNTLNFELVVRGSVKEYPGKTAVLKAVQQGLDTQVYLESDGVDIIAHIMDGDEKIKSGIVSKSEKGDLERLKAFLEILSKRDVAQQATVTSVKGNAYTVSFTIEKEMFEDVMAGRVIKTLEEVKNEVISNGIVEEQTLQEIEKYLTDNKVPQKHIKMVFEKMKVYKDDVAIRIPNPVVRYKDTAGLVKKAVIYLNKGKHLRLVGEKGTGKNVLIETLAWVYQRPLYEMALNSQTDKMDILGSKTFESELDENGHEKTVMSFEKEVLVEAMEVGGFMNLDEVNTADPSVLVLLHPIADGRGRLEVPGYGLVEADSNFGLLLTMNRDYIGTTPLNEATRDRFVPILFPEVPSIAQVLATRVPGASPNDIALADSVYGSILKLVKNGELTNDCITNRGFIDALEVSDDLGLFDALIDNVANRIEDEEYRNTVASIIDSVCG